MRRFHGSLVFAAAALRGRPAAPISHATGRAQAHQLSSSSSPSSPYSSSTIPADVPWARRCHTQSDVIQPDEISFLSEGEGGDEQTRGARAATGEASSSFASSPHTDSSGHSSAGQALTAASSSSLPTVFEEVRVVDTFSRARVTNFVKRHSLRRDGNGSKELFTCELLTDNNNSTDGEGLYHCRLQLPLPHPQVESEGDLWAHGLACTAKEAELLAAMHAERIIDELGYPIYTLPSMQRRHALAARAAGRRAPNPDGDTQTTAVVGRAAPGGGAAHTTESEACGFPLPLRRVAARDESEGGSWQLVNLKEASGFRSASPTTLLSPCVPDEAAQSRVQLFFRAKGFHFTEVLSTTTEAPSEKGADPFFITIITLPAELFPQGPAVHEKIVARGKARMRETAITLACMHAELVLDALDIPLFPSDDRKQKEHAMVAWAYGRPAPLCGATAKDPAHVSLPLPLKELVLAAAGGEGKRFSFPNQEEDLVHRHRVVSWQITDFHDTTFGESTAVADLQAFLKAQRQPRAASPFFHEVIQGMVKSTVVLPVADAFGVRGGVGIATRGADADTLAAMHALDILTALGIPAKADSSRSAQERWAADRARKVHGGQLPKALLPADPSPPGWRLANGSKTLASSVAVTDDEHASPPAAPVPSSSSFSPSPSPPQPSPPDGEGGSEQTAETAPSSGGTHFRPRRVVKRAKAAAAGCVEDQATAAATSATTEGPTAVTPAEGKTATSNNGHSRINAARKKLGREFWSLEADSPDGYIMVEPSTNTATSQSSSSLFSELAVLSPRQLDTFAKQRVTQYLATVGRRFEDVFFTQFLDSDGYGSQGAHRCVGTMPVPRRFGDRVAIGEATTGPEAEHLAAMHAELILDTLGVCVFADARRQRRHAEVCAQQGRLAPSGPGEEQPDNKMPSPPPLRREYVGSLHWERQQERKRGKVMTVSRHAGMGNGTEAQTSATDADAYTSKKAQEEEVVVVLPSMEMDESAAYTSVLESELDLVAKPRVQYYLRRRGVTAVETEYTMAMGRGTILHEATWELPLPDDDVFTESECTVKGIAATKRDADVLSWMHAERTLDALGVPLFDNLPGLQQWHAARVAKQGRSAPSAPTREDPSLSCKKNAALPPLPPLRLSTTTSAGTQARRTEKPLCPPLSKADAAAADWHAYVEACAMYIQEGKLAAHNAFFDLDRVPRTGEPLIDEALDEVDAQPASTDCKMLLNNYCLAAGTQYPAYWKSQTVGPLLHRVSWAVIPVPGFEYVHAQGVGVNKEAAQRRAAMHALSLLKHLDPDYVTHYEKAVADDVTASATADGAAVTKKENGSEVDDDTFDLDTFTVPLLSPSVGNAAGAAAGVVRTLRKEKQKQQQQQQLQPAFNARLGEFTYEGKVRVVELLSLCLDVAPPTVSHLVRVTQDSSTAARRVARSTIVSFTDDEGKSWAGTAAGDGAQVSEQLAYLQLYDQLEKDVGLFGRVKSLFMRDPYLDPRAVPHAVISKALKGRVHAIVGDLPSAAQLEGAAVGEEEEAVDMVSLMASRQNAAKAEDEVDGTEAHRLLGFIAMSEAQSAQESQQLLERYQVKITNAVYLENFAKARERLSITARRDEIVRGIDKHPILIICGTTGCGKTTQVPQFILDHLTNQGRGGECSILITQPRRLSAVSIAQRVAAERLERLGDSVGYTIRFDSRPGKHINFCTSGILLRMLHSSPTLDGINYLIIDEIHERDINSDFLIILLRDLLAKRSDLRVILMSATLQAEQFAQYFGNAPVLNVEGYVYPVEELYLEDLVPYAEQHGFMTPLLKEAAGVRDKALLHGGRHHSDNIDDDLSGFGSVSSNNRYGVLEATTDIDYPTIQFAIEQAVRMVDLSSSSVLVFLPGWEEITRAREILERNTQYQIIPLHSSVGQEEQMQCFLPAQAGKVKVILSTNIAESGVTIDDVGAVIDVGRAKEKTYLTAQAHTNVGSGQVGSVSQLLTVYASRANCVQRRGRVGRTRPGVCIRLYSKLHFNTLHAFQTPEMLRTPLDSLCLQILSLHLGDPADFLAKALEPPTPESVESAMARLRDLGATTSQRALTPLGLRLSMLPVEPKMGKVILLGALLKCLDSALTIASVTQTDVFVSVRHSRDAVRLHKEDLSKNTQSDPIASVNGFNFWVTAHCQRSPAEVVVALQDRLLSVPQLMLVSRHKKQFYEILKSSGFLDYGSTSRSAQGEEREEEEPLPYRDIFVERSALSQDAQDVGLVKCIVAAGLLPNVAVLKGRRSLRTKLENHIATSSDSVLHRTAQKNVHQPYFVFSEIVKSAESSKLNARELTNISLWTLLLIGTTSGMPITYEQDLSLGFVDGWLPFRASFGTLELIRKLRRALHQCLSRAYTNPADAANNERLEEVRLVLKELVSTPMRPNALGGDGAKLWEDAGVMLKPETATDAAATTTTAVTATTTTTTSAVSG